MKLRMGFVSNSSSSSFVCDVSGEVESGWDLSLSDCDYYQCESGHTFAGCYLLSPTITVDEFIEWFYASSFNYNRYRNEYTDTKERIAQVLTDNEVFDKTSIGNMVELFVETGEYRYSVSHHQCPICSMKNVRDEDMLGYLLKKVGGNRSDVANEIRDRFKTYTSFKDHIKRG